MNTASLRSGVNAAQMPGRAGVSIIDDDPYFVDFLVEAVSGMGYAVDHCGPPGDLDMTLLKPDQILLLDLQMPGFDGIEVLREIASQPVKPRAIILISGLGKHILRSGQLLSHELGLNIAGFLTKPVKLADLREVVDRASLLNAPDAQELQVSDSALLADLRTIVISRNIDVHFQPICSLRRKCIVGFEALARWSHPDHGMVPPSSFINVAEKHRLIENVDWIVLEKTIEFFSGNRHRFAHDFLVSVNMSYNSLRDVGFVERLINLLERWSVSPENLTIEFTETGTVNNLQYLLDVMIRLRMNGISLAIDDFGTGCSSMKKIIDLPFNKLKIDRSFVDKYMTDQDCAAVVRNSIKLANQTELETIAEGIEDAVTMNRIGYLGCDRFQGYLLGRPVEGPAFLDMLENNLPFMRPDLAQFNKLE